MESLFSRQLEEKEKVIRQQQMCIQELRMQLTSDQRSSQVRTDELSERLRHCERERNDARTRLAGDLRKYQIHKDELVDRIKQLEAEKQNERDRYESRIHEMAKDHT